MEEMNFLPSTRPSYSTFPICQHLLQVAFRLPQSRDVRSNSEEFLLCEFKDPLARSITSVTSFQDFGQFRQCKPDAKCPLNDANPIDCTLGIDSIPGLIPHSFRQDADLLVMPNGVWTHARRFRQFAGVKSPTRALHHDEYQPLNAFQCQGLLSDNPAGTSIYNLVMCGRYRFVTAKADGRGILRDAV